MDKKIFLISALGASVLAIIAMVMMAEPGNGKSSKSSDKEDDAEQINVEDYSPLGQYIFYYNEVEESDIERKRSYKEKKRSYKRKKDASTSTSDSPLASYIKAYNALVGESDGKKSEEMPDKQIQQQSTVSEMDENSTYDETEMSLLGVFSGHGTINDKYAIDMNIVINDPTMVQGSYFYTKNGPDNALALSGTLSGNNLTIEELDDNGDATGIFDGIFDGHTFKGTWTNTANGKSMPFSISFQQNLD